MLAETTIREGERVEVAHDIDLQPHTTLRRGERGVVVDAEAGGIAGPSITVRLDKYHPGLTEWSNEAYLVSPELAYIKAVFKKAVQPTQRIVKLCYSTMAALLGTALIAGVATAETLDIYCGRPVENLFRLLM